MYKLQAYSLHKLRIDLFSFQKPIRAISPISPYRFTITLVNIDLFIDLVTLRNVLYPI